MSKKEEKYLPLRMAEYSVERDGAEGVIGMLADHKLVPDDTTLETYTDYLFGPNFFRMDYHGRFEKLNRYLQQESCLNYLLGHIPPEDRHKLSKATLITELQDMMGISSVIQLWSRYKQVYKLDGAFFGELADTKGLAIPYGTFLRLPVRTFYIDLSACEGIDPIRGAFVHAVDDGKGGRVVVYMVTDDATTFSYYSNFLYGPDGICTIPEAAAPTTAFVAVNFSPEDGRSSIQRYNSRDCRKEVIIAILQVLVFLSAEGEDITENPTTKSTYRPSPVIRNRFSEIRMWDVGVRYGKAIRIARDQLAKGASKPGGKMDKLNGEESKDDGSEKIQNSRKPPRPHVRCAHWQRYHVGPGRTEIRVNWVPPIIVYGDHAVPVTIHDIR